MASTWSQKFYSLLFDKSQNEDLVAFPNLPLTGNLASILVVNIIYIGFVLKVGPWLMKNREPCNVKSVLKAYNILQIVMCSILFVMGIYYLFFTGYYDLGCVVKLPVDHPGKRTEIFITYIGYLMKYVDYFDTVFIVLRKSYRQVTFLHVYHHFSMTFAPYIYLRSYGFSGHPFASGVVNLFVHIIMYSYYLMIATRPEMKKNTWWKRHITELQLLQFVILITHQMWPLLFRRDDCTFPKIWLAFNNSQLIFMTILFANFYKKTYLDKKSTKTEGKEGSKDM